jgi:hypothetical protein
VDEERIDMSEELSGPEPDDTAAPGDPGLAERLIRDEFSEETSAHRTWFHREDKEPDLEAGAVSEEEVVAAADQTAEVPVVASGVLAAGATIAVRAPTIHEAFVPPTRRSRSRSHRTGMLAGLGVVGALLVVLVVFAPGGSKPHLPAQSVHDVSPITASGPKTAAATTPSTAAPSTTTSSAPATTPATQQHQSETISTIITYSYVPGATPAAAPTTAPSATTTTAPPPTTTTTLPPTTTTTTSCLLGLCHL